MRRHLVLSHPSSQITAEMSIFSVHHFCSVAQDGPRPTREQFPLLMVVAGNAVQEGWASSLCPSLPPSTLPYPPLTGSGIQSWLPARMRGKDRKERKAWVSISKLAPVTSTHVSEYKCFTELSFCLTKAA